jgi:hypothetical protein
MSINIQIPPKGHTNFTLVNSKSGLWWCWKPSSKFSSPPIGGNRLFNEAPIPPRSTSPRPDSPRPISRKRSRHIVSANLAERQKTVMSSEPESQPKRHKQSMIDYVSSLMVKEIESFNVHSSRESFKILFEKTEIMLDIIDPLRELNLHQFKDSISILLDKANHTPSVIEAGINLYEQIIERVSNL